MEQKVFTGQREGEKFVFMFRRHIIAMRKGFYLFLGLFAVSCLPVFFVIMSGSVGLEIMYIPLAGFVLGLILFLYHLMLWHFSIYIVTDQRIRQISQYGLFSRKMMDLPLSKIQSVNFEIPGLFGELFHFGTINILTGVGDLMIKNADHPESVYNKLQDVIANVETEESNEQN